MQAQRKSHLDNIIVTSFWDLQELDPKRIKLCQCSPHFWRDDFVRLAVKDVYLRDAILRENLFQRSDVIETMAKKARSS